MGVRTREGRLAVALLLCLLGLGAVGGALAQPPRQPLAAVAHQKTGLDEGIVDTVPDEKVLLDEIHARNIRSAAAGGEYGPPNSVLKAANPRILERSRYNHVLNPSASSQNGIGNHVNTADVLMGTGLTVLGSTERDLKNGEQNTACPNKCQKWDSVSKVCRLDFACHLRGGSDVVAPGIAQASIIKAAGCPSCHLSDYSGKCRVLVRSAVPSAPIEEEQKFQHVQNSTAKQTNTNASPPKALDQKSDILIIYPNNKKTGSPLGTLVTENQGKSKGSDRVDPGAHLPVDETTQTTSNDRAVHDESSKAIAEERLLEHGPFEEEAIEDPPILDEFDANEDFETDAKLEEERSEFDAQNDRAEEELEDEQRGMAGAHPKEGSDQIIDYDYTTDADHGNHSEAGNSDYDAAFEQEVERLYDESEALADLETDIQEDLAHDTLQQEDSNTTVYPSIESDRMQPSTSKPHVAREYGNSKINEAKRAQLMKLAREQKKMKTYPKNINEKIHAIDDDKISSKKPEKTNFVSKSDRHDQPKRIIPNQNLENSNLNNENRNPSPPSNNNSNSLNLPPNSVIHNPVPNENSNATHTPNVQNPSPKSGVLAPALGRGPWPLNSGLRRTNSSILAGLPGKRQAQEGHSIEHPTVMMSLLSGSYLKCPVCSKQDPRGYCRPVFWCGMWPLAYKTKP